MTPRSFISPMCVDMSRYTREIICVGDKYWQTALSNLEQVFFAGYRNQIFSKYSKTYFFLSCPKPSKHF